MKTIGLILEYWEIFTLFLALVSFCFYTCVRLVIYYHFQKSFNETTEKRLNELENHNKHDVQEIKTKLIKIEMILTLEKGKNFEL